MLDGLKKELGQLTGKMEALKLESEELSMLKVHLDTLRHEHQQLELRHTGLQGK